MWIQIILWCSFISAWTPISIFHYIGMLLTDSLSFCLSENVMLLLSHVSRVRLCATPEMAAHQPPPSLGFSRQGDWSGLPFPSPMHESEKWKWSPSVVSDPQRPHGLCLPGSSVHGISQARALEWGAIAFSNIHTAAAAAKSLQSCPTLLYIKLVNNKHLLYSTENYTHHFIRTYNRKKSEKEYIHTYVCITDSLCCIPETNTIL